MYKYAQTDTSIPFGGYDDAKSLYWDGCVAKAKLARLYRAKCSYPEHKRSQKTKENTEVVLRSILFIDSRRSTPSLDYDSLAEQSQKAGKPLRCVVFNSRGQKYGEYEVLTVDPVPDVPATRIHHIELGLV